MSLRSLPGPKSVHEWASAARSSKPPVPETTGFSSSHEILRLIFKKSTLQIDHDNSKITELKSKRMTFIICKNTVKT